MFSSHLYAPIPVFPDHPLLNQLDMVIDNENSGISKHLGQIADAMYEWEGRIADELGLSVVDVAEIKMKYSSNLKLQTYVIYTAPRDVC